MPDLVYPALTVAFFVVALLLVKAVNRLSSVENLAGLVVSVALLAYLVVALLFPERF